MNLPNKLSVLRVILVPFFVAFLLLDWIPFHTMIALAVFIAASVTDAIDGKYARKHNMVTTFGKFLDPLADKVLVISAMLCFVDMGLVSSVPVIIIIAREFLVTSLRLAAVETGEVIAASTMGKIKTAYTMGALVAVLLLESIAAFGVFPAWLHLRAVYEILMWIAAVLTVASGVEYVWVNRKCINVTK